MQQEKKQYPEKECSSKSNCLGDKPMSTLLRIYWQAELTTLHMHILEVHVKAHDENINASTGIN